MPNPRPRRPSLRSAALALPLLGTPFGGAGAAVPQPELEPGLYQDRVIAPGTLPDEVQDLGWALRDIDPEGMPRSLSTELKVQSVKLDDQPLTTARWMVLRGSVDTPNHGFITLDVAQNLSALEPVPGLTAYRERNTITLLQRQVPMANGWFMNNGFGLVQPSHFDLIAQQYRFGLPTRLVTGASTAVFNPERGTGWQASLGTTAALDPIGQAGYSSLGGRVATAGWRLDMAPQGLRYAVQAADHHVGGTRHLPIGIPDPAIARRNDPNSQGVMQSLRIDQSDRSLQLNLLHSRSDTPGDDGWRTGLWMDGSLSIDTVEHRLGLNKLPQNQRWAGLPVASGAEGGYYRWRWRTRQTVSEVQVDRQRFESSPLGGPGARYTQLFATQRYQVDRFSAVGLQALWSRINGQDQHNLLAFQDRQLEGWSLRALAGLNSGTADRKTQYQLGTEVGTTLLDTQLSASLSVFSEGEGALGNDVSFNASRSFSERLSFGMGVRQYNALDAASAGRSVSATAQYRLSAGWTASAALSESRGARVLQPTGVINNAPTLDPFVTFTPRQQYAFVSLRYDWNAGSATSPLGATPGRSDGSGTVTGLVFLDANGNGLLDPGEQAVSQVLVVLNGRYSVRTDLTGRFLFPSVATGEHTLTLFPDNLPLPWFVTEGTERRVKVAPRDTVQLMFAATTN